MKSTIFPAIAALIIVACTTTPEDHAAQKSEPIETVAGQEGPPSELGSAQPADNKPTTELPPPVTYVEGQFEPLVYGTPMDLICKSPLSADGPLAKRPNLQVMWENYLYNRPEGIWGEIGGKVEVNGNLPLDQGRWTNACAVRLSHMLNKAGHKIPRNGGKTVSGANKDQYYYRLADMETYLNQQFGPPDIAITDGSGNSFDLPDAPGIVLMDFPDNSFTGHVTVWNGAGTVDGANIGGYRVLFWDLPCFIPPDRKMTAENAQDDISGD